MGDLASGWMNEWMNEWTYSEMINMSLSIWRKCADIYLSRNLENEGDDKSEKLISERHRRNLTSKKM